MKTLQLSIRGCPEVVHQALKKSARSNRRSLNNEAVTWLDQAKSSRQIVTGKQASQILRGAWKLLAPQEHRDLANDIEAHVRKVRRERLH